MNTDKIYVYDLEVFPNCFTFAGKFYGQKEVQFFEISDRVNQCRELYSFLTYLQNCGAEMAGWNNLAYDYHLIHNFMTNPYSSTHASLFEVSQIIIEGQRGGKKVKGFGPSRRLIPQLDFFKIGHYDNVMKRTSLKAIQFAMRSASLEDLPFDIRPLNDEEKNILGQYNIHDVTETEKYISYNLHHLEMRREYQEDGILKGDVLNFSDTKIGTEYLISRLGKDKCYEGGQAKQTFRPRIDFKDIILPKIRYRTDEYNETFDWFLEQTYVHGGKSPSYSTRHSGLKVHFGVGGIHASAENKIFETNDTHQIIDIDVAGMYPAVAIANRFAPEHLGQSYVAAYKQVKEDRAKYPKGTPRNLALKLAGNSVYGNSNNKYSVFYDTQYTYSVTINGQLQLLQLVEMIDLIPDCELIQANTDGITVRCSKENEPLFSMWCKEWENQTGLVLERVDYSRMFIRDVNNYIAETMEGKLKSKGAYWYPKSIKDYDGVWHKNFSNLASKKAAEKYMVDGWPIEATLKMIVDPFDFMLRYKCPGGSHLYIGQEKQLKTVRYYVSTQGQPMTKISPPKGEAGQYKRKNGVTQAEYEAVMAQIGKDVWDERIHTKNKSKYEQREIGIEKGWKVENCNVATDFRWENVDWQYYIEETEKLIIGNKK